VYREINAGVCTLPAAVVATVLIPTKVPNMP